MTFRESMIKKYHSNMLPKNNRYRDTNNLMYEVHSKIMSQASYSFGKKKARVAL